MENSDKALDTGSKRVYDVAPSEMFGEFMKTGWAPTPLEDAQLPSFFRGFRMELRVMNTAPPQSKCLAFHRSFAPR